MMRKIDRTGGAFSRRSSEKALRRLLGAAVVVLMLCLVLAAPAAAWEADTSWYEENPDALEYSLSTASELAGLAELVNQWYDFSGKTIVLVNDINLENQAWTPIGSMYSFSGIFDGQYHSITNLNCSLTNQDSVGLFGGIYGGTIKNLILQAEDIQGAEYVGTLVGRVGGDAIQGYSTVSNILIDVSHVSGMENVGGAIGGAYSINSISNITVLVDTVSGTDCVGGVIGNLRDSESALIHDISVTANHISSEQVVGGAFGHIDNIFIIEDVEVVADSVIGSIDVGGVSGEIIRSSIANVQVNAGEISSPEESYGSVGGIAGYALESTVENTSVIVGSLTSYCDRGGVGGAVASTIDSVIQNVSVVFSRLSGGYPAGGIVGSLYYNSTVSDCYVVGTVTGEREVGGIVGSTYEPTSHIENCISLLNVVESDDEDTLGRIVGDLDVTATTLSNNYAWEGLTNNGAYFSEGGTNGISVSSSEFWNNQAFFEDTLGWDFENTWKINSGNSNYQLPVLQFMQTPVDGDVSYLTKEVILPDPTPTPDVPDPIPALPVDTVWYTNNPSASSFILSTAAELSGLAELVNAGTESFSGKTISIDEDIDLSGGNWIPIGTSLNPFYGKFYGNGKVISNLTSYHPDTSDIGLFGCLEHPAEVVGVNLSNVSITGLNCVGGITGTSGRIVGLDGAIRDCFVEGGMIFGVESDATMVGGIAGVASSISNCTVKNCVISGEEDYVGGITGRISPDSTIQDCAVIACSISGNHYVTGIVGYVAENCSITFCQVNDSTISGTWIRVAGIAGLLTDSSIITNCIVENSTINGPQYVSGIAGYTVNSTITNCIFNGTLSGFLESGSSVGGISGYLEASTIENCIVFGTVRGTSTEYASTVGGVAGWVDSGNIQNCLVLSNVSSSDNAGGIIGYADSNTFVENCLVLAQAIDSENDDSPYGISGSGILENNYVWNGTLSSGSFFNTNIGINAVNGAPVSSSEFWNNQAFFEDTLGWDFENTWKINSGNSNYQLPVLQFMKTPVAGDVSYLTKEVIIPEPTPTPDDSEPTPTPGEEIMVTSVAELADVLEADVSGNVVTLTKDVTLSQPIGISLDEGEELILTTAGDYTISRGAANYSLFNVYSGTLTLKGKDSVNQLTIDGRKDVFTKNTESLVSVWWGGTLNLSDNAILTNNSISDRYGRGAGVYVYSDGALYITGGCISNNDVLNNGAGGGVFCAGNVVMTLGSISNNTVAGMGGGVEVMTSSSFDMFGGEISNNTARVGGGIDVHGEDVSYDSDGVITDIEYGYFNMSGGCIDNNTARSSSGIFNYGIITISGGEICNHADYAVNSGGGNIVITGGTFSNNTHGLAFFSGKTGTSVNGETLYHKSEGKLSISGDAIIPASETVNLHGNSTIQVIGPLSENAGVYNIWISSDESRVIVNATTAKISGEDLLSHFVLNKDGYSLTADGYTLVLSATGAEPTPTPEKPAAPTLTPPESLPEDATVTTNTVAETNAATKAEVGYQVNPADVTTMKAPTITRGKLSVQLNEGVKVVKTLADGNTVEVEATVNEDGSINLPSGALDDAAAVTVNFIGRQFGDVTNDGKPDTLDAARVLQASVGLFDFSGADTFYGDVSGDGLANTLDAARILQYSVSLVDENYVTKA